MTLSQLHYIILGNFGLREDSLEHTSADVFGTVFRRFYATWKKSICLLLILILILLLLLLPLPLLLLLLLLLIIIIKRYNLCKVLACSTTFFQLSLFCTTFFQLRTFMFFISSKTSSSQRVLALPIGLLDMGSHLLIFCTLLSSATWKKSKWQFYVAEMICYIAFRLLNGGKPY